MAGYVGYAGYNPDEAKAKRLRGMADLLTQQSMTDRFAPVQHWTQGLGRVVEAMTAGNVAAQADKAETAYATDKARRLAQFLNPNADEQGRNLAPDVNVSADPAPAPAQANPNIRAIATALGGVYEGDGKTQPLGMTAAPMPPMADAGAPTFSVGAPVSQPMPKPAPDRAAWLQQAMRMTGGDSEQAKALVEAKFGAPPRQQFLQGPDGAISLGNLDTGTISQLQPGTPKPADPVKMEQFIDATGQVWDRNPYTGESKKANVPRARIPQDGGVSGNDTFRPATPEEKTKWGIPVDAPVKINNRTGEPAVISGAKSASEYTPTQQNKFIQQAGVLDSMEGALNTYRNLVKTKGPQMWTTGKDGDNPDAKELDAARTAVLIQAKELFNLGVLNGPDLDIIGAAVPGVTGFDAIGKSYDSVNSQLSVLGDYISRGRNQIPAEFITKSRPNGAPAAPAPEAPASPSFFTQKFQAAAGQLPPAGVTAEEWQHMSPEDKALFQ